MKLVAAGFLAILCISLSISVATVKATNPVMVEFFYWDPSTNPNMCWTCPGWLSAWEDYQNKSMILGNIEMFYEDKVLTFRIDYKSSEYDFYVPANSFVVNHEYLFEGKFTEEDVKLVIDAYLAYMYDVAVLSVILDSSGVPIGEVVEIEVVVKNKGNQPESFNVTVFYDDFVVETLFVELLAAGAERVLVFYWNTTEVMVGNYTLSAYADPVLSETIIDDNWYYAGVIEVRARDALPSVRRDVAVASAVLSKSLIGIHEEMNVTVTVSNVGTETEDFGVNIFLNSSLIEKWAVTGLGPKQQASKIFALSTDNLLPGVYVIKVQAEPVDEEINLADNERTLTIRVIASPYKDDMLSLAAAVVLAFTFGFFETFSPCLFVLLSFVLSYTIGESSKFRTKFSQIMAFAVGFVAATILVFSAIVVGLIVLSLMLGVQHVLMWIVSVFAILFGLDLLGFNLLKIFKIEVETKPLIQKLTRKHVSTYAGLAALGFLFYFLDPCIAPVFVAMVSTFSPSVLLDFLPFILFTFCLGVIIPFVAIGILAGSISKLARNTYRHKEKIRAVSGLILIIYALFLLFSMVLF